VHGFNAFCHPGYFVSPLRLSGSTVETLFSQYKRLAGGKLDAANYITARAAQLIQQTVVSHHSGKNYCNCTLEIELKRKNMVNDSLSCNYTFSC